jgi:hypothetical protein
LFKDDAQEAKHREMKRAIAEKERELASRRLAANADFEMWRKEMKALPAPVGMAAHYTFDSVTNGQTANALGTNFTAKLHEAPSSVPGKVGSALKFSGENSVTIDKVADFKRSDPFSFSFWIQIAEELPEIIVLHHQQAGSDAACQGYQFVLEDGYATFALVHFWPGNAVKVRTREKLKLHEWLHLGITYDGSSRASGVKLYLNGVPAATEVVRDSLFKDFANGQPLTLGARFRGRGFKDGLVDELKVFNSCLTSLEMAEAFDGTSLENASADVQADQRTPHPNPLRSEGRGNDTLARLGTVGSTAGSSPSPLEGVRGDAPDSVFDFYLARVDGESAKLSSELKNFRNQENDFINRIDEIMVMGDSPVPRPTYVLKRGQYDAHGDVVEPATPESILPLDPKLPRNRLGLGRWLIDPQNPLTSRVMVNRYWQLFFGKGLVVTAEDFGSQGALPSHPELLDWLAKHFIDSGWDLKALCKLIVTSATYRQSSQARRNCSRAIRTTSCWRAVQRTGLQPRCCATRLSPRPGCS